MSSTAETILLEHYPILNSRVDRLRDHQEQFANDVAEIKARLASLEFALSRIRGDLAHGDETDARQQAAIDRLDGRVSRIERRLELGD